LVRIEQNTRATSQINIRIVSLRPATGVGDGDEPADRMLVYVKWTNKNMSADVALRSSAGIFIKS